MTRHDATFSNVDMGVRPKSNSFEFDEIPPEMTMDPDAGRRKRSTPLT